MSSSKTFHFIFYSFFVISVVKLNSAQAADIKQVDSKKETIQTEKKRVLMMTDILCSKNGFLPSCFKLGNSSCEKKMEKYIKDCKDTFATTTSIKSEAESQQINEKLNTCIGSKFVNENIRLAVRNPKCQFLAKFMMEEDKK